MYIINSFIIVVNFLLYCIIGSKLIIMPGHCEQDKSNSS